MEGQTNPRRTRNALAVEPLEDRVLLSHGYPASLPFTPPMLREAAASTLAAARDESIPVNFREILHEMRPRAAALGTLRSADGQTSGHAEPHEPELGERIDHLVSAMAKFSREETAVNSFAFDRYVESQPGSDSEMSIRPPTAQSHIPILPPPSLTSAAPAVDQVWLGSKSPMGQPESLAPGMVRALAFLHDAIPIDAEDPATPKFNAYALRPTETTEGVSSPPAVLPLQEGLAFHLTEWQGAIADFLARLAALGDPHSRAGISVWLMAFATILAGAALEAARRQSHSSRGSHFPSPTGWAPEAFLPDEC